MVQSLTLYITTYCLCQLS